MKKKMIGSLQAYFWSSVFIMYPNYSGDNSEDKVHLNGVVIAKDNIIVSWHRFDRPRNEKLDLLVHGRF